MYKARIYFILFAGVAMLLSALFGCSSNPNIEQGEGLVFDTVPVFEKDTFLYPLAVRSSSFLYPEVYFGDIKTIDGDYGTAWQTLPGLVTGEYVEFDFDSLYLGSLSIVASTDIRYSKVKNVQLYIEGKSIGVFPIDMRIPLNRKVNTIRIELGETEGINTADIPFEIDSTTAILHEKLITESVYASKSVAIFEFEFLNEKNEILPIRSLPVKKAKMNLYGVAEPQQLNNARLLFDGRKEFGWKGTNEPEKVLLFSFSEDQIINGIFFPFRDKLNLKKIGFRLRKRSLPEYEVKYTAGNGIFIALKNTLKGKNFELLILETENNEAPFIPEMLFHDGSRLFSIYSDSLQIYQQQRLDSSLNNPLADYIDNRVVTRSAWKEYALPLKEVFSKNKTGKDTLPQKSIQLENTFRLCSNGTFLAKEIRKEQSYGEQAALTTTTIQAEGYWILKSKTKEQTIISCYAEIKRNENSMRLGKEPVDRNSSQFSSVTVTLMPQQILFSDYFALMKTSY